LRPYIDNKACVARVAPGELRMTDAADHEVRRLALLRVVELIGNKWAVMVIALLDSGSMRFTELRYAIGCITARQLTVTLRKLAQASLVRRIQHNQTLQRVEYELTPLGASLAKPTRDVLEWASENTGKILPAKS